MSRPMFIKQDGFSVVGVHMLAMVILVVMCGEFTFLWLCHEVSGNIPQNLILSSCVEDYGMF